MSSTYSTSSSAPVKAGDADAHLTETTLQSTTVYEGSFLKARRDVVRLPNGNTASREYIIHPGAVVIIPLLEDDQVLLERQYRYPVGKVMTEFPAGKLDPHETPLACAQRELLEETGYTAGQWAYAGALDLAIAYSTEVIHIFFAKDLRPGQAQLDHDEFLEVKIARVDDVLAACGAGGITDAKTLTCMLWLQNVRNGAWTLDWQPA
ncbi:NUDIX domain-containing protein [Pusillimonas sp. NJUB218]|uniref:NUDIX domain-containing protein n=1 Tax=Pusillimonas sp. NJUB218 TaxID=2023230 RepID=UPI000F4BC0DA|nr:NUDIX hydrolase [Pusillimonas sp. NJUB218]ROT46582.1 ADP-ribose pyrophosphatase [Pusillimonas sp. NJUB218]